MKEWFKKFFRIELNTIEIGFNRYTVIWAFFCMIYFCINLLYISDIISADISTIYKIHSILAILSHSIIVCLIAGGLLYPFLKNRPGNTKGIILSLAMTFICFITIADIIVYKIYTFHINGFVLSEISQPDFIESAGLSKKSLYINILQIICFVLIVYILIRLLNSDRWSRLNKKLAAINGKKILLWIVLAVIISEKIIMLFTSYSRPPYVYKLGRSIPVVYVNPVVHLQSVLKIKGIKDQKETFNSLIGDYKDITYPLKSDTGHFSRKYNIIILSMESTRQSYITKELAPRITDFYEKYGMLKNNHFSGSNSTHLGIYSLIYGINPFYHVYIKTKKIPSFPLSILRENNYSTAFYTSTSLKWHRMDYYIDQNFDTVYVPDGAGKDDTVASDMALTKKILKDIDSFSGKKQFVMAHFASTHYPFYFPADKALFKPYLDEPFNKKNYLFLEKIRPKLINSFYNSLAFIDGEFGKVIDKLISTGHIKDTIVIITSDHGCEFGEDGHYFYSSTLTKYQTQVPMIMYVPSVKNDIRYKAPSTHLDVFPTIFDALGYDGSMINMQGHSLLKESDSSDYAIVTYQEVFEPKRYSIIDSSYKLIVDYDLPSFIDGMTDFDDAPVKDIPDKKKRIKYLFDSIHYFRDKKK